MATYSLKKSYQLKNLREINFKDLWGDHGVFTTMWIFGKPAKILFFENHIKKLIKSLKIYGISKKSLNKDIIKILNINLSKGKKYDHLLRIALNKKVISISLRKRVKPKIDFKFQEEYIESFLDIEKYKKRNKDFFISEATKLFEKKYPHLI